MTTVMTLPNIGEISAVEYESEHWVPPEGFNRFGNVKSPEVIGELVGKYNYQLEQSGPDAFFANLPHVDHADNGLDFTLFGEPSEVLIVLQNPFATDLSPINRFRGQFLHSSLEAESVTGPDGVTPQVLQIASASRAADVPLAPLDHLRLASGKLSPVARKVAEVIFEHAPASEKVISVGYSLSGFLTPDILMSVSKYKDVLAALIANPPGVQPESMNTVLKKFIKATANATEHLMDSGLNILEPNNMISRAGRVGEKAGVFMDVVRRPTNLSLWSAFSRGKFLERVQELHRTQPNTEIDIAFGYDDPLCSPEVLEPFLVGSPYGATVIEKGDHCWGMNLPRSLGHLVTGQIKEILTSND